MDARQAGTPYTFGHAVHIYSLGLRANPKAVTLSFKYLAIYSPARQPASLFTATARAAGNEKTRKRALDGLN